MDTNAMIVVGLATLAVGALFQVFAYPYLSGDIKAEKRKQALKNPTPKRATERVVDSASRRKQVADSLKETEKRKKSKLSLEMRIAQAGLSVSRNTWFGICGAAGLLIGLGCYLFTDDPLVSSGAMAVGALGLPNWMLKVLKKRRIAKFIHEFPNSVDVIVRGIKAGLPLGECLRVIAGEAQEPVRTEFRLIVEAQAVGLTVSEAVERIVDRVPVPEANFFAIVISIQQRAGGNLSEALGNLSRVLRERKKMKQKISAMSSEAKASAGIIGALPFIVAFLVYLTTPKYMELLWTTSTGRTVLAGSFVWMAIGIGVMRKMISFEF